MKQDESIDRRLVPLWIPFALTAGPVVALGFSRFAYALILPAMVRALGWSLATAGAMNTINALGYLLGALATARLSNRWGLSRAFIVSLLVTSLAVLGTGAIDNSIVIGLFRFVSGAAGGVAFVTGGGLVAQASVQDSSHRAALLLGIYFGGAGLGIVLSAWIVPILLTALPHMVGWRIAWGVLGAVGLLTLVGAVPAAYHVVQAPSIGGEDRRVHRSFRRLRPILIAYGLYGAGYIAYMTFIVIFLQHHGVRPREIVWFWTVLGSAATAFAFVWGWLLGRVSGGRGVAVLVVLVLSGVLLPLWSTATIAVLGSAVLFGSAFLAVVTAVTTVARRNLPVQQWTAALASLTVAFGLGQSAGPLLAGLISTGHGGVRTGLILSAVILTLSALSALAQQDRRAVADDSV